MSTQSTNTKIQDKRTFKLRNSYCFMNIYDACGNVCIITNVITQVNRPLKAERTTSNRTQFRAFYRFLPLLGSHRLLLLDSDWQHHLAYTVKTASPVQDSLHYKKALPKSYYQYCFVFETEFYKSIF